ncbi:hypothetical protein AGMMS49949_09710 [Alphaproteobacteria bacterium]|nr:hypothetical protein AGMMS49949_09710 [Alphaproteobacteria bacterium]GHT00585.1 hypothetical protein AGMMS50296_8910 [Alphaproteobacteria bacterium]
MFYKGKVREDVFDLEEMPSSISEIPEGGILLGLMPEAQGRSLNDLLPFQSGTLTSGQYVQMGESVGRTLATLHNFGYSPETNTTRTTHGDAHGGNIFYDPATRESSLIDFGSFPKASVVNDFDRIFEYLLRNPKIGDLPKWGFVVGFFKGYSSLLKEV